LCLTSELFIMLMLRWSIDDHETSVKMGTTRRPEISLYNCRPILSNIPEERWPQLPWTIIIEPIPTSQEWRTREFFRGVGVKQIQLRAQGRENGELGAVVP
jgi:hypothetical protein